MSVFPPAGQGFAGAGRGGRTADAFPEVRKGAMGSKFMSIYVADLAEIERVVGSGDADLVGRLEGEATEELGSLVDGDYPKDEQEDERAADLIRALEILCLQLCPSRTTIEMNDDREETPLLWDFLWSGWEGGNPLRLPVSPWGTPAVTWHGPDRVARYRGEFERWRAGGVGNERFIRVDELDDLVAILTEAVEEGRGVFVFYSGA